MASTIAHGVLRISNYESEVSNTDLHVECLADGYEETRYVLCPSNYRAIHASGGLTLITLLVLFLGVAVISNIVVYSKYRKQRRLNDKRGQHNELEEK